MTTGSRSCWATLKEIGEWGLGGWAADIGEYGEFRTDRQAA